MYFKVLYFFDHPVWTEQLFQLSCPWQCSDVIQMQSLFGIGTYYF